MKNLFLILGLLLTFAACVPHYAQYHSAHPVVYVEAYPYYWGWYGTPYYTAYWVPDYYYHYYTYSNRQPVMPPYRVKPAVPPRQPVNNQNQIRNRRQAPTIQRQPQRPNIQPRPAPTPKGEARTPLQRRRPK